MKPRSSSPEGDSAKKLGISGNLTRAFIASKLTPLLLLAAMALGGIALVMLPREEEPQISVPMVDIQVRADGLKAQDAERLVTEPLETIVKAINGVEHVYSTTYDDRVVVTARFLVGTKADEAILRVHDKVRANLDRIPIGIPEPLIVGRGIDDVAILVVTLAPKPEAASRWNDNSLYHLAEKSGSSFPRSITPALLISWADGRTKSASSPILAAFALWRHACAAHRQGKIGKPLLRRRSDSRAGPCCARGRGQTLHGIPDIGLLLLTTRDGRPVYVRDVANIVVDGKPLEQQSWNFSKGAMGS